MARGFGTTDGQGTTDLLTTGNIASTTLRSFWIRFKVNTLDTVARRPFEQFSPTSITALTIRTVASGAVTLTIGWTGTDGVWRFNSPEVTTGVWHTLGITYDGGLTTNDPIFYYDNTTPTVVEGTAPTTALDSATEPYIIGNAVAADRVHDGSLAEFAIWNVILSAGNMTSLFNGVRADQIGVAPTNYWLLCGTQNPELNEIDGGSGSATVSGTKQVVHPTANCARTRTHISTRVPTLVM